MLELAALFGVALDAKWLALALSDGDQWPVASAQKQRQREAIRVGLKEKKQAARERETVAIGRGCHCEELGEKLAKKCHRQSEVRELSSFHARVAQSHTISSKRGP